MLFQVKVLFPEYGNEDIIKMMVFEHLEEKLWPLDISMMSLKHEHC